MSESRSAPQTRDVRDDGKSTKNAFWVFVCFFTLLGVNRDIYVPGRARTHYSDADDLHNDIVSSDYSGHLR